MTFPRQACLILAACCVISLSSEATSSMLIAAEPESITVFQSGSQSSDARLTRLKDLNGYFPFQVPSSKAAWLERQAELKQRVLVATGLYPMPEKTPLNAVIHGKVQRKGFTVEKVYFESLPGHFVSGLLFRPDGIATQKRPAVLSPHGHGGRQYDYGESKMDALIQSGAELHPRSGRFPKLARCAQLARMGCVTFTFDMLGYVDSQQIPMYRAHFYSKYHEDLDQPQNWGFHGVQAEGRLHNILGLQMWNCIRSLDFLESLSDVDPARMAVTGGSGGGTQTILLGAIDDRHIAGFPNGMVSTSMQGGCTCENTSLLRIGTGNVELAALFAPRPQSMTAANDWTKEMMTKGFPQLRQLYAMLGVEENVDCKPLVHFPHNYNAITRGIMYSWMNKHLHLGIEEPIQELDWEPLTPQEYTVWDAQHPMPAGGDDYERQLLAQLNQRDLDVLMHHSPEGDQQTQDYYAIVRAGWQTLIGRTLPDADDIQDTTVWTQEYDRFTKSGMLIALQSKGEQLPVISIHPDPDHWNHQVVLWIDGGGKSGMFVDRKPNAELLRLVDAGYAVVGADLFGQGELTTNSQPLTENPTVSNPQPFAGHTYGYNDTVLARRVHDILTLTVWANAQPQTKSVHAVSVHGGGVLLAAARSIAVEQLDQVAIDTDGFRFENLQDWRDIQFLPGAIKYGDLPTLLALSAPHPLCVAGERTLPAIVQGAYGIHEDSQAPFVASLDDTDDRHTTTHAVDWILQRNSRP